MRRESHVRFWEGVGVRFPCATQLSLRILLSLQPPIRIAGSDPAIDLRGRTHTAFALSLANRGCVIWEIRWILVLRQNLLEIALSAGRGFPFLLRLALLAQFLQQRTQVFGVLFLGR